LPISTPNGNHSIDGLRLNARVDIARRGQCNLLPVQGDPHRKRSDDDDLVADRLENCRRFQQQAGLA